MAVDLLPGNLLAGDEPFNDEQYVECLLDNDLSGEEMADTEQYAEDAPGGEQSSGNMPDDEQSDKAKSVMIFEDLLALLAIYKRKGWSIIIGGDSDIAPCYCDQVYLCLTVPSSSATTSNRSTQLNAQRLKDPKFMKYLASMYHDAIPLPEVALTDNPCNTLLQISKRVHEYCQELDSEQDQTVIEKVKQLHKQYIELAGQQMSLGELLQPVKRQSVTGCKIVAINQSGVKTVSRAPQPSVSSEHIQSLQDSNKQQGLDSAKMAELAQEFYADLYANSYTEPWAIDRLLEWHHEYFRKRSFSPSTIEQSNLVGEIMREEVWDACNEAEENQAPGPDGLPVEFYLYCDEAREILYQLANHILTDPLLLTLEFTAGYITVQYKGTGNARELANYQPIFLQNSSVTIIADIIARHI
ncbi:hypothetical protein IWW40_000886 [Coemansia sp. RSA 1250]|nr:hypothetical protein IWW40_000886 [Coemansia sp. RSA 1250]